MLVCSKDEVGFLFPSHFWDGARNLFVSVINLIGQIDR